MLSGPYFWTILDHAFWTILLDHAFWTILRESRWRWGLGTGGGGDGIIQTFIHSGVIRKLCSHIIQESQRVFNNCKDGVCRKIGSHSRGNAA
jgi:hypothetical protein